MNSLAVSLRNQVRSLFRVRRVRRLPKRGPKPRIGASIFRDDVRLTVQAGMTDELWLWFLDHNWRELAYRPERRRYREVPSGTVMRLFDCDYNDRLRIMLEAVDGAAWKPTLSGSTLRTAQFRR
ncbi:MAG TPA: hypothetical protein VMU33_06445 [Burkholderiaceae bacterium]|nr:hypothetical protein [Burkholderiaceae bacterium]